MNVPHMAIISTATEADIEGRQSPVVLSGAEDGRMQFIGDKG